MLKEKSIISNHFCICFTSKIYKNSEKKTNNQIYSSYSKNSFRYELFCFPLLFCTAIGETEIEANLAIIYVFSYLLLNDYSRTNLFSLPWKKAEWKPSRLSVTRFIIKIYGNKNIWLKSKAFLGSCKTSMMELCCKNS